MKRLVSVLALCFALGTGGCAARDARLISAAQSADRGLVVTGEGEARAAPDIALVRVGIEAHRPSMAEARGASAEAQTRVLGAIAELGVSPRDVRTEQLTLSPDYEYGPEGRALRGYVAVNTVLVRLRDVTKVGAVVDAAVSAGGDDARVDGVSYEVEDPTDVAREARRRAIDDARERAEQLATELGVRVGAPLAVEEGGATPPGPIMMRMEAAGGDAPTPTSPGQVESRVSVRVRFAITR